LGIDPGAVDLTYQPPESSVQWKKAHTIPDGIVTKSRGVTGEPRADNEVVPINHLVVVEAIVDCETVGCCSMVTLE
jgi:hypothetical protein